MKIGLGYDVHRLVENRKLIVGGVNIPYFMGLLGHSDADVLTHAIMDAMLGAVALGDIGKHFPDSDEKYHNISSLQLLSNVNNLVKAHGYAVSNVDSIIVAQAPKFAPYINEIREILAETLEVDITCVSVKATTTEGLGFEGEGLGISAKAVVMLCETENKDENKK